MTGRIKKANKQRELDALVFNVLSSFRHQGAMQWVDWYEATRARRGKPGLGNSTFSKTVKRLTAEGRVQVDGEGCYQAIFDAVENDEGIPAARILAATEINRLSGVLSGVLRGAGNGNADIADIALQQLVETEA